MRTRIDAVGEVEALRRLLAAQQAVSTLLAELPPSTDLFHRVLDTICGTFGWAFGAVWRREPGEPELGCLAVWNAARTPEVEDFGSAALAQRFAAGQGLPGRVLAGGTSLWLPELLWDPRMDSVQRAQAAGLRSAVAVPLPGAGGVAGVLELFATDARRPDPEIQAWLESLGAQMAQCLARWEAHEALIGRDRALAAAVNGVVIGDARAPGFPIVYANPGFERLTGYSLDEVRGRSCRLLQGPETDPGAVAELSQALAERRQVRVTLLNHRKDGTPFWNEVSLSPVLDEDGELVQYIGVQNDVTERRAAEDQARFLAYHDPLTGLANRALLQRVLARAAARARQHALKAALLYVDLDGFKGVNDSLGHAAGDELLREVARRLSDAAEPGDLLARQAGDEFLLLVPDLADDAVGQAVARAERLQAALAAPVRLGDERVRVRASVGVSLLGRDADDTDTLLRHADAAMYRAKRSGGGVKLFRGRAAELPAAEAAGADDARLEAALAEVLAQDAVTPVYQPIVDLDGGGIVAYEALARGPQGSPVERPDRLFAAARRAGRLAELDWACRGSALRGAFAGGLTPPRALFVNVEPDALGVPCPAALEAVYARAGEELDVVVEVTERALTARPAELLRAIEEVRARGWRVALDDVGADVRSLALMPLLRPDVIKLDLRLVQEQPSTEIAEIVNAVNAERERTGALILAEGIETEEQLATARAMGATLGQGWLFGRPGPLDPAIPAPSRPLPPACPVPPLPEQTPFAVVRAQREVRRADKRLLLSISLQLEHQAAALGETALILSAFQGVERFTPLTHRRYTRLGADAAFVAALGVGMDARPAPNVRGAALRPGDPLLGEWSVAVLGPHFAAALVAVDLGDTGPDMERRFDFALTYDRDLVTQAASALMARVAPLER
jgi:diguanylate cyclase (GGDEF)-like protein/PAS domain S-box-containing protein